MRPLSDQQRLFLVESDQLYRAWREVMWHQAEYRYGMSWKHISGREYLVKRTSASGNGKSLGPRSKETEQLYQRFQEGRATAQDRYAGLSEKLAAQTRLNRALRLGRLPSIIGEILLKLDEARAITDFRVVGTHAMFAYEAMAAVEFKMELLASGDVDLLYDGRKRIALTAKKLNGSGLLGLLKKVDKSFEVRADERFRAVNRDGFMVDFITQDKGIAYKKPDTMTPDDLELVEVPNLEWLANAQRLEVVVIAANGMPVMMPVPDPRAFAVHKVWLSRQNEREPVKKQRDFNQACMVYQLVREYLPQYPLSSGVMKYFPLEVVQRSFEELSRRYI